LLAGLAIFYPLYLLSFVSLVADLHMRLLYNSSFSKGLALAVTKQELELPTEEPAAGGGTSEGADLSRQSSLIRTSAGFDFDGRRARSAIEPGDGSFRQLATVTGVIQDIRSSLRAAIATPPSYSIGDYVEPVEANLSPLAVTDSSAVAACGADGTVDTSRVRFEPPTDI
jgi:hypothetical protein